MTEHLHHISCLRVAIVGKCFKFDPDENSEFEPREDEDDDVVMETKAAKRKRVVEERKIESGCLDAAFEAASTLYTSDYVYMKGVDLDEIPQRVTYHIRRPPLPDNDVYNAPEMDEN